MSRTFPKVALLLAMGLLLARAASAQIYEDLDRAGARNPMGFFKGAQYISNEIRRDFLNGSYDTSRYVYEYRERISKSLDPFKVTLATDPSFQLNLAGAYLWVGRDSEALAMLQQFVGAPPPGTDRAQMGDAWLNLATALEKAGQYAKALEAAQKGHALRGVGITMAEQARIERVAYKERALREPDWARRNFSIPDFTRAWNNQKPPPYAFMALNPPGGVDQVERRVMLSIRFDNEYAEGWALLAMCAERRNDLITAYELYRKAIGRGHARDFDFVNHRNALSPHLPRGYSIPSLLVSGTRNAIWAVIGMFFLSWVLNRWGPRAWRALSKWRSHRRAEADKRRWRADRWQDHHLDGLHRELETRLKDEKKPGGPKG